MEHFERREFAASDMKEALEYIASMPETIRRIQVDVFGNGSGWVLAYGDERAYVPGLLAHVVRGRRFRLRGILDSLHEGVTPYFRPPSPPPGGYKRQAVEVGASDTSISGNGSPRDL